MGNITFEVTFDRSGTRAAYRASSGEYVCANMQINGEITDIESITLTGVGRTRSVDRAQMWLDSGIEPEMKFA